MGAEYTFRNSDETSNEPITDLHPLPVAVMEDVQSKYITASTKQVAPVTAATGTLIAPANPNRRAILITNITGTQVVYIGFSAVPTSSNGQYLHSAAGSSFTTFSKDAIWGLSITAAQTLSVCEETYNNA